MKSAATADPTDSFGQSSERAAFEPAAEATRQSVLNHPLGGNPQEMAKLPSSG